MRIWSLVLAAVLGLGIIGAGSASAAPRHNSNTQLVKKPGKLMFITPGAGTEHRPVHLGRVTL